MVGDNHGVGVKAVVNGSHMQTDKRASGRVLVSYDQATAAVIKIQSVLGIDAILLLAIGSS